MRTYFRLAIFDTPPDGMPSIGIPFPESKIREYINHRKMQRRLKYTFYAGDNRPAWQPGGVSSP